MNTRITVRPLVRHVLTLAFCAGLAGHVYAGENLATNPGMEDGTKGWSVFMAKESEGKGAGISFDATEYHSGKYSLKMFSPEDARYSVAPHLNLGTVTPGDRYRVSIWVRAGADFVQKPGTPGFHIRATLFESPGKDVAGGHYHFGLNGRAIRGAPFSLLGSDPVPHEWTQVSGVFVIPEGTQRLNFNIFVERASGSLYLDDIVVIKVGADTPLTPLLKAKS
jgi:hypothetical protein